MSSGTTWKDMPADQPRFCAGCGEKITLKGEALMFITSSPPNSWHARCYLARKAA